MNNALRLGLDGWVYAAHGFSNTSAIVSAADGSSITLNSGNTYRFRPDGTAIEQFTHGQVNPFGLAFNAFFKEFVGIALRWRGIPFKYNTSGTDNNRDGQIDSNDRLRQFNNMFTVGVIFTLPPKIKTTD